MKAVTTMMISAFALILSTSIVAQKSFPDPPLVGSPDSGIGKGDLLNIIRPGVANSGGLSNPFVVYGDSLYEYFVSDFGPVFINLNSFNNSSLYAVVGSNTLINDVDIALNEYERELIISRHMADTSAVTPIYPVDLTTAQLKTGMGGTHFGKKLRTRRIVSDLFGRVYAYDYVFKRVVVFKKDNFGNYTPEIEVDLSGFSLLNQEASDIGVWDNEIILLVGPSLVKYDLQGNQIDQVTVNDFVEFSGASFHLNRINVEENGLITITAIDITTNPTSNVLMFFSPDFHLVGHLELPSTGEKGNYDEIREVDVDSEGNIYLGQTNSRAIHILEYVNHPPMLKELLSPKTVIDMANFGAEGYLTSGEFSLDSARIEDWNVNDEPGGVIITGFEGDGEISYDILDDNSYSEIVNMNDTLFIPRSELDNFRLQVKTFREDSVAEVNKLKVFYKITDAAGAPTSEVDTIYFNTYQGLLKFDGEPGKDSWFFMTNYLDDVTYYEFFSSLGIRTSGSINSDDPSGDPNVFNYDTANEDFFPIANLDDTLSRGESFIFKVFEDDDPNQIGVQGGWPKQGFLWDWEFGGIPGGDQTLRRSDEDIIMPLQFTSNVSEPDFQGLNIIGNPFGQSWKWSNSTVSTNNVSPDIAIWRQWPNNGDGAWEYPTYPDINEEVELKPGEGFLATASGTNSELSFSYSGIFNEQVVEGVYIPSNEVVIPKITAKLESEGYYDEINVVKSGEMGARYVRKMGNPTERFHEIYVHNPTDLRLEYISGADDFDTTGIYIPFGIRSTLFDTARISIDLENLGYDFDSLMVIETFVVQDTIRYYEENGEFVIPLTDDNGVNKASGKLEIVLKNEKTIIINSSEPDDNLPTKFSLSQNYPNPFNPSTQISYSIPENGIVRLKVFDLLGREVAVLVNEVQSRGNYSVKFDASELSSGMYLYRLETTQKAITRKMMLMK